MSNSGRFGDGFNLKRALLEKGWSLDGEYVNAQTKSVFVCPRGHKIRQTWCALRLSFFCQSCRDDEILIKAREMLSGTDWNPTRVKNCRITIRCPEGHEYRSDRISEIRKKIGRSPRCSECELNERGLDYKTIIEESGWRMNGVYCGFHAPIACVCPNGHFQMKAPSGFLSGRRCRECLGLSKYFIKEVE